MSQTMEKKQTLLEISEEMTELLELIDVDMERTGGDVSDGTPGAELMKRLEAFNLKLRDKVDAYCTVIRIHDLDAAVLKDEAKRLTERAQVFLNKAKRMKELLGFAMLQIGTRKVEGVKFTAAIQAHGGKQPMKLKDGIDVEKAPARFVRVEKSFDADAIRAALEGGDPEAQKLAELLPRGEGVRIR